MIETDKYKARLFLSYLGNSKKRIDDKDFSKKKVALQLRALRRMGTESIKEHIDKLEKNIAEAIAKEKNIISVQKDEEFFHADLRQKIHKLERKLGRYLATKEARQKRIEELEEKVHRKTTTKREQLHALREELKRLERLYTSASKTKGISKTKLKSLKKRITAVKEKLSIIH